MPDVAAIAAPISFLGALAGILTYLGNAIVSDRKAFNDRLAEERAARKEAEEAADVAKRELETETRARWAAERDLATAELEMERLVSRIEGFKERELDWQRAAPRAPRAIQ